MRNKSTLIHYSLFLIHFSLACACGAAEYTVSGTRYLRKYTSPQKSQVYMTEVDAQRIANKMCEVAWEKSETTYATATTHVTTNLDWNVGARESFDAALFCAGHKGDEHVAYANAACYVFEFPGGSMPTLTNLEMTVYSDPYNAYGARISVMASDTLDIPTDCATVRGDADGGIKATGVCRRVTRTVGNSSTWYPATTNVVFSSGGSGGLGGSGLQLKRYLFVFVLMENYATSRGNWLEGCSWIENEIKIKTSGTITGWTSGCDIAEPYATQYHLKDGHADEDWDGDGLSNYAEYLITEVFKFAQLDPDNPKTNGSCVDGFRKVGNLYLKELFTGMWNGKDEVEQRTYDSIKLKTTYYGNRRVNAPVVVQAWSKDRDAEMTGAPDETFETNRILINGERTAEATRNANKSMGLDMGGKYNAVAFADEDGDGAFTPGEPFCFLRDCELGQSEIAVNLSDDSAVFARIDLLSGKFAARRCSTGVSMASAALQRTECGRETRVRVIRSAVDGSSSLGLDSNSHSVNVSKVVLDKYIDLSARSYLHEGDFLEAGSFDIEWGTLASNVYDTTVYNGNVPKFVDATNITYSVVLGDGSTDASASNVLCYVTRSYDSVGFRYTIAFARMIRPVIDRFKTKDIIYGACPTFRWAMQDGYGVNYDSYTAFKLQVTSGNNVVYDSGYRLLPPRDANGWYSWTLDQPVGSVIPSSGNYGWRVSMYNAKYRDDTFWENKSKERAYLNYGKNLQTATWSDTGVFVVNLDNQQPMNDHGYSSIAAAVKYTGPARSFDGALVRVQAFTTADFAGAPVGETTVWTNDLADVSHNEANAYVLGIPQTGTYYLRAFIDSNGNGKKDAFESWGAASEPVTISDLTKTRPTVGIYIEDADTDGDWIPDAYEYALAGRPDDWKAALAQQGGEVIGNDAIVFSATIAPDIKAGISTGLLGASLTIFQNEAFAVSGLGLDARNRTTISAIRKAVDNNIHSNLLKIVALTLAPDSTKASISLTEETTDSVSGDMNGTVYDLGSDWTYADITINVYAKPTQDASWGTPGTFTKTFKRGRTVVDVPITGVNMTNGFYKVEVGSVVKHN